MLPASSDAKAFPYRVVASQLRRAREARRSPLRRWRPALPTQIFYSASMDRASTQEYTDTKKYARA